MGQKVARPARAVLRLALHLCLTPCELGGEKTQPLGESDPHGEHFRHKWLLVQATRASEADASMQSQSLDALPVEAGVLACRAPHGFIGDSVFHSVQADAAGVVLAWTCLHCLLWAVLPAEGPVCEEDGRDGRGKVGSEGRWEAQSPPAVMAMWGVEL